MECDGVFKSTDGKVFTILKEARGKIVEQSRNKLKMKRFSKNLKISKHTYTYMLYILTVSFYRFALIYLDRS